MPSPTARLALAHDFQPQDTPPKASLLRRIAFVIAALLVYRLGTYIPLGGVDYNKLIPLLTASGSSVLISAAKSRLSIFSLGVWPYISASLLVLFPILFSPSLAAMTKTRSGRLWLNQIIKVLTAVIAGFQGYKIADALALEPGLSSQLQAAATYAGASLFLVWLADRITARDLGNGVLLLLFTDIVASLPPALVTVLDLVQRGTLQSQQLYLLGVLLLAAITGVVFIELARRRILLQRPRAGDVQAYLPLQLNPSGLAPLFIAPVFPPIVTVIAYQVAPIWFETEGRFILGIGSPGYFTITAALILWFAIALRSVCSRDPAEIAALIERSGASVPGVKPGANTAAYIACVQTRIAVLGAVYITAIGLLPGLLQTYGYARVAFGSWPASGGWPLLVVVMVPLAVREALRGAPRGKALL